MEQTNNQQKEGALSLEQIRVGAPVETRKLKDLYDELTVDPAQGLSTQIVSKRQAQFGKNILPKRKKRTPIGTFLAQLNNGMIYVLLAAAVISFSLHLYETLAHGKAFEFIEVIVILAVVLLNAIIGTVQELKADKALEALEKLSAPTTVVRRNGQLVEVKAEELVVGDIVILEEGRTVPADLRLISAINLKAGEASLTGESVPSEKDADLVFGQEMPIGDRKNMVFMSTPITYGRGEGIVVGTGTHTEIGRIATLLEGENEGQTPLQKRLHDLSKLLGIITIVLVVLLFIVALIQDPTLDNILAMFMTSISLAVAAVPEGLPAVVTIVLSLGVQRMVKVNTIVRKLPSVETLGAVSVICSDKTGTLTQNKMTVVRAFVNEKIGTLDDFNQGELNELASGMSLCSNASVDNGIYGDPTEIALVEFANYFDLRKDKLEKNSPRVDELPFDSVRKMMSTVNHIDGESTLLTKGALDQILKHTTKIKVDDLVRDMTKDDLHKIQKAAETMAATALRVLALAKRPYSENQIEEKNLIFIGLVGMVDPPRPEAAGSVKRLKAAGITTIMITGDHVDTAFAIATELGIATEQSQTMSGEMIDRLDMAGLQDAVRYVRVFARVSPENKVQIVKALKANGEIVAMTGDGVNDAPSLKAADIGIAMGITGTDVAKGAADMVLSDDNFVSIGKAVEEGRGIYANIKKTVWFLLSSNFGEVISMIVAILIGLPAPLAALHILWVNLITDSVPAIALGADEKDPDLMKDKPRNPKESLFARGGYFVTVGYGALIALLSLTAFLIVAMEGGATSIADMRAYLLANDGAALMHAQTYAFTVLGVSQLFHMLGMSNIKKSFIHLFSPKEWLIWVAFVSGFLLQIAVTELNFLNVAFGTTQLHFDEWLLLAALSTGPLVVHELIVLFMWIKNKISIKKA
ncbi:MAG: cation-translocating P-type ATPase [Bacilli bacterium]